jgi:hypothetical protein
MSVNLQVRYRERPFQCELRLGRKLHDSRLGSQEYIVVLVTFYFRYLKVHWKKEPELPPSSRSPSHPCGAQGRQKGVAPETSQSAE